MANYFKVTNATENHYGFQYVDGLNILIEKFNNDPDDSCCGGGFYFTTLEHIHNFYDYGVYLREVFLPTEDPEFQMVEDSDCDKWRANRIILGKKYSLGDVETYKKFMIPLPSVEYAVSKCFFDLYLFLTKVCCTDYISYEIFDAAVENNNLEFIKYFLQTEKYEIDDIDDTMSECAKLGHIEILKYFVEERKFPICEIRKLAALASENGNVNILKYLVEEHGLAIDFEHNFLLRTSVGNGEIDVVKYLME